MSKIQAISGVSAGTENEVMTVYPSIAATGAGRMLGSLFDSIPVRIGGIKLSNILFPPLFIPFGLLLYFAQKATGEKYVLTNRHVQRWKFIGARQLGQVALGDIAEIDIVEQSGQAFFKAGDLLLRAADGRVLSRLSGVVRPAVFRQSILKAREARRCVEASLATIQARQPA